ncbi:MAG: cytochrome P450 [Anaerolineae bacterium]|nr:cytochrome P450 [Anaerolineae bacterium]
MTKQIESIELSELRTRIPGQLWRRFRSDPLGTLTEMHANHGDMVAFKLFNRPIIGLFHPDLIQDVLVRQQRHLGKSRILQQSKILLGDGLLTSEGDFHLRQRRLMQPVFHRRRIAEYGAAMVDACDQIARQWQSGSTLDIHEEMMRLTLSIVGRALFDVDVAGDAQEVGAAMDLLLGTFSRAMSPLAQIRLRLPLPSTRRIEAAIDQLNSLVYRIIAQRRTEGGSDDLVSMLLAAGDGDERMTDVQIRDEVMTLLLAGHETTANALTWTWYLLSQNPEAEQALHAELDAVLAGRLPTVSDMDNLPYTRMVVTESLRLYPPAWALGRTVLTPIELNGYAIDAGTTLFMSQWIVQRDARWYAEPDCFRPMRWQEDADNRPKFAYFPFGGGSRLCIGEHFAWMEAILAVATLAQHWQLRLEPGHPVVPQPAITLRPRYGMRMLLQAR